MSVAIDATSVTIVNGGSPFDTERIAVAAFVAGYGNDRTRKAYTDDLRRTIDWCDRHGIRLMQMKRAHVELLLRDLEQRYAPSSVCRRLTTLRMFFDYCVAEDWLEKNPCLRVKGPRIPDKPMPYLRHLEMEAFLNTAEKLGPREDALACLLLLNALRVSEVCSARIEDLGEHRGMVTLSFVGKGTKFAQVPLAPRTAFAVKQLIGDRKEGPIFLRRDGEALDKRTAWFWVRRIARKAGIDHDISPHALRRSAITAALNAGVPIRDVAHFARHADVRTTTRYDQSRFSMEANATFALQAFLSRG